MVRLALGTLWAEGGAADFLPGSWFPFVIILVLFYFMLIVPERKKRAELQQMLGSLKKNDRIVTHGGMFGTVVNIPGPEVITIRVDENNNTRVHIQRSAVARIITADESPDKKGVE